MLYRKMPKIDIELSSLGFGCMRLPTKKNGILDRTRAVAQIRYAIDNGVNYLDTAWPYHGGESEPLLAEALEDGYREKAYVATKLPSWMVAGRKNMDEFLTQQLERLKTDCLDFYLIHNLSGLMWSNLKEMGVLDFIDKARQSGKVKHVGFSFHGWIEDFKAIIGDYPWEFCQIQYNFLDEQYQAGTEGLKYAASKDLGVIVMEPLRGGSLGLPEPPPDIAKIWESAPVKRSPVEWALRWVWDNPEVAVVLSGMNEELHIEENIKIAGEASPKTLTSEELTLVKKVSDTYKSLMKVNCTGCEYCKPCPEGVNISAAFETLNRLHLYKDAEEAKSLYAMRCAGIFSGRGYEYASQCVQCGECLEKCPQQIPIPDILEDVVAELEDDKLEERIRKARAMLNMD